MHDWNELLLHSHVIKALPLSLALLLPLTHSHPRSHSRLLLHEFPLALTPTTADPHPNPSWADLVPHFRHLSPKELAAFDPSASHSHGWFYTTIIT